MSLVLSAARLLCAVFGLSMIGATASAWQLTSEPPTTERYQRYISDLMNRFDSNGDGFIDNDEQKQSNNPVLAHADADGDGRISAEEILNRVTGPLKDVQPEPETRDTKTTTVSSEDSPATIQVSLTVLKLPDEFVQSEILSLEDIFKKVNAGNGDGQKNNGHAENGIHVHDRFEFEAVEGMASELSFAGESVAVISRSLTLGNQGQVVRTKGMEFSSDVRVLPVLSDGLLKLDLQYRGRFILPGESGSGLSPRSVALTVDSDLLFRDKNVTALNIFSGGHHFLMIVTAESVNMAD